MSQLSFGASLELSKILAASAFVLAFAAAAAFAFAALWPSTKLVLATFIPILVLWRDFWACGSWLLALDSRLS